MPDVRLAARCTLPRAYEGLDPVPVLRPPSPPQRLPRGRGPFLALLMLLSAAGAIGCGAAPPRAAPPAVVVAPVISGSTPLSEQAAELLAARRYAEAGELYASLSRSDPSPEHRAEFAFAAAECAFARGDYYAAYRLYSELLQRYPTTPRFAGVVERVFTISRLFAEGRATKPSWLLGAELTDRSFGVELLTAFQKARERHPLADDALHHKALALVELGEGDEAIEVWQKLIDDYPDSEWLETAEFRIGVTMLARSEGPEYDKRPLLAALERLRSYARKHPNGDYIQEASQRIAAIEEDLAGHWLEVARFYLRRDRIYSARIYLEAIGREYPRTRAAQRARALLEELPPSSLPPPRPDPD
ncbi:MAG: outer membrane protein assembly factor BamD, partial [Planctomycetota bacterium]